jgi:la-related protein 1
MVYPRSMPPPPLPVTQVANIDALRYYVLGQVEYYFSMQNLAMDFFLRQQVSFEADARC